MIVVHIENTTPKFRELSPSPELLNKKWSYSNVYHLKDLRNIYILMYREPMLLSTHQVYKELVYKNIVSESGKDWTERKVLEIINALKNFNLVDIENGAVMRGELFTSDFTSELSNEDIKIFQDIYTNYFRFRMFLDLLTPNEWSKHPTLYAFMENSRFYNRFYVPSLNTIYYLSEEHADAMRFWEVTMKWGKVLGLLNKCSMSVLDCLSSFDWVSKSVAVGLVAPLPRYFSVLEYIQNSTNDEVVYIPNVIWKIVEQYGYSIEQLKKRIVDECSLPSSNYNLQKASAIFVTSQEAELLPIVGSTYMSHLLKI